MPEKIFEKKFSRSIDEVRARLDARISAVCSNDEVKTLEPRCYWNAKKTKLVMKSGAYPVEATVVFSESKATAFMEIPFLMSFFVKPFKERFVKELDAAIR